VNICLSVITLGIYSAWAKVRTNSYFYGNTVLNNSSFSYLADPKKILKARAISVILFAIYWVAWQTFPEAGIGLLALGGLLFPFFIVSAMSFRMRNSAYKNIRFYFFKDLKASYLVFLMPLGLVVLFTWLLYTAVDSFGVLDQMVTSGEQEGEFLLKEDFILSAFLIGFIPIMPWLDYLRTRFIVDHTQYGKAKASFNTGGWGFFFKVYLVTALIYFAILLIYGGFIYAFYTVGLGGTLSANSMTWILIGIIFFYAIMIFISGIWKAMRTNMINNNIKIGENQLYSHLKGAQVGWIYLSNTIAIVLSAGLFIPWAKVRMARYAASRTELQINDLDSIKAIEQEQGNAFGEEMDEIFDMDIGF
jgi:uncharacterized membrane protein YjgN (DUF898 family)